MLCSVASKMSLTALDSHQLDSFEGFHQLISDPPFPRFSQRDSPCHLLDRTGCRVHARAPQLGGQQMPSAEYTERQVAIAIIVAVEKPSLLLPMHRIVS